MPARPCRTPQSHEATWAVEHVAPQGHGSTDALSGGATCIVPHVARGERVKRHGRRHMSHGTRGSGDMDAPPCRPSRARRATCKDSDVALRDDPERHARARMSHFATIPSDMQGLEFALRDDPERHALLGMSLRTWVKYEIHRLAGSPDGSSQATFTVSHLAQRARVVRHAAAPWVTSMSANAALGSQAMGSHEKSGATVMPADSAALLTHRQMALGLTVEELGELLPRGGRPGSARGWRQLGSPQRAATRAASSIRSTTLSGDSPSISRTRCRMASLSRSRATARSGWRTLKKEGPSARGAT